MPRLHNHDLVNIAKSLRKNMTDEERKLWYSYLKNVPFHFSRQKIIGNYIVDFYCARRKLIIELDGSQHFYEDGIEKDNIRDEFLTENGFKILRFTNLDVNNRFRNVCEEIDLYLNNEK